jgi:hypothetical protein
VHGGGCNCCYRNSTSKHSNQLVYGSGALGSCIAAIEEEKEEEKVAKHHYVQLELIEDRWLVGAEQHNNQLPNRIERISIEFVLRFGDYRNTTISPISVIQVDAQLCSSVLMLI